MDFKGAFTVNENTKVCALLGLLNTRSSTWETIDEFQEIKKNTH